MGREEEDDDPLIPPTGVREPIAEFLLAMFLAFSFLFQFPNLLQMATFCICMRQGEVDQGSSVMVNY